MDGNLYLTEKHEGSVTGEVIRTGKAVALADASADARSAQGPGHHPRPTRPLSQPGATGTMRS